MFSLARECALCRNNGNNNNHSQCVYVCCPLRATCAWVNAHKRVVERLSVSLFLSLVEALAVEKCVREVENKWIHVVIGFNFIERIKRWAGAWALGNTYDDLKRQYAINRWNGFGEMEWCILGRLKIADDGESAWTISISHGWSMCAVYGTKRAERAVWNGDYIRIHWPTRLWNWCRWRLQIFYSVRWRGAGGSCVGAGR